MSLNGECLYHTLTGYTVLKCVRVLFLQEPEFRPTYGRLHELRALVPRGIPLLAATATATPAVRREVIDLLDMRGCEFVFVTPDRPMKSDSELTLRQTFSLLYILCWQNVARQSGWLCIVDLSTW